MGCGSGGMYERLRGRADALIRKYGKARTVIHNDIGVYDPVQGRNVTKETRFSVHIVTFPYEIRFINNTTIRETDLWGMFSAVELPITPQPGDKLDMGEEGGIFTFGPVRPLSPGGVPVYYECHLNCG